MRISDCSSDVCSSDLFDTPSTSGIDNPLRRYQHTKLTGYALADTMSFMHDQLQLSLGVRRQQVEGQNYNFMTGDPSGPRYDQRATTPFAGVVFKVRPDLSLYASYVEGLSQEIGRAHVCTPVTNAHLVCRLLLEKKK